MENTQKHYTRGEIEKARQSSSIGLIIRQKEPKVLETPVTGNEKQITRTIRQKKLSGRCVARNFHSPRNVVSF